MKQMKNKKYLQNFSGKINEASKGFVMMANKNYVLCM